MTARLLALLAVLCLAGIGVPPLSGQVYYTIGRVTYTVSDSLPDDPAEFARQVQERSDVGRLRNVRDLFLAGCVADGGWAEAAFDGLERLAETDSAVRYAFASELGDHWDSNMGHKDDEKWGVFVLCDVDHPRIEGVLTRYLREEHEAGLLLRTSTGTTIAWQLLRRMEEWSEDPDTYEAVREILSDMTIASYSRAEALNTLVAMHGRIHGETQAVADSTVRANIGEAWGAPHRFVGMVAEGTVEMGLVFEMGCPADGGWPERAYNAVLTAAETDFATRRATLWGLRGPHRDPYHERCPADVRHLESWLVEKLLAEHQAGLLHGWWEEHDHHAIGWRLVGLFQHRRALLPETYGALRTVACDHSLYRSLRENAAAGMERHRVDVLGEQRGEAQRAIRKDIGFNARSFPREGIWPIGPADPRWPLGHKCEALADEMGAETAAAKRSAKACPKLPRPRR